MQQTRPNAQRALESVGELRSQIKRLQRRLEDLENRAAKQTTAYGLRLPGEGLSMEDIWSILCDERERLGIQLERLMQLEQLLERSIEELPRETWRMILRYRYLDEMAFPEIRDKMRHHLNRCYSTSQLYRLNREAIAALDRRWSGL